MAFLFENPIKIRYPLIFLELLILFFRFSSAFCTEGSASYSTCPKHLELLQSKQRPRIQRVLSVFKGRGSVITLQISQFSRNHEAPLLPLWNAEKSRFGGFGRLGFRE